MGLYFNSILTNLFVCLLIIFFLIYVYCKKCYNYWSCKNIQYIEPTFPLGNFSDFIFQRKNIGSVFLDIYEKLKSRKVPYGGFYLFTTPHFMPLEPELIKTIVTKEFAYFPGRNHYINEENDPLTTHMAALTGMKWKNLRTKLTPTFTSSKMKMMYQFFRQCSDQLTEVVDERVRKAEPIDIKDFFGRFTTDVIGNCAFGIESNALTNSDSELMQNGQKVFKGLHNLFFIKMLAAVHVKLVKLFNLKQFGHDVTNFFTKLVHDIVEYREKNNVTRNDMMSLLIKIKHNESIDDEIDGKIPAEKTTGEGLSMSEIIAQTFIFFFAGSETSSSTMSFCLYELAANQDIQDKLRADILETLKKHNNELTYEALLEMSYLDKVVKETLRKYPIAPNLTRKCVKDFRIPNTTFVIEKNISVIIPTMGLHYDPDYYPEPNKFDPERFSKERKDFRHQYVYLPFGEGPRICIGMRFGLLQIKIGIASLIRKFKFTVDSKTKPLEFYNKGFLLGSRYTIWLQGTKL